MILYKYRKKTNEELYESNIRSDFSSTIKVSFALCIDSYCILLKDYYE